MRGPTHGLGRIAGLGKQTPGTLMQVMAGPGEAHGSNGAVDQLNPEGVLEMTD
jgi:hypothetical protein